MTRWMQQALPAMSCNRPTSLLMKKMRTVTVAFVTPAVKLILTPRFPAPADEGMRSLPAARRYGSRVVSRKQLPSRPGADTIQFVE